MNGSPERRASIAMAKEALERKASIASNTSLGDRRASVDTSEKGEYRKVQNDMGILSFRVRSLEEKMERIVKEAGLDLKGSMGLKSVAFTASLTNNVSVSSHQVVPFDDVITNYGKMFKASSHVFKVPYTGRYLFSVTIRAQYQKQACAEIVTDLAVLGQVSAGDTEIERATSTITVVASLDEGDEVYVRNTKTWTGHYYGEGYCVFTGISLE